MSSRGQRFNLGPAPTPSPTPQARGTAVGFDMSGPEPLPPRPEHNGAGLAEAAHRHPLVAAACLLAVGAALHSLLAEPK